MLHPATELRKINDQVGYGIFATQSIPQGTITWALDPLDQIFDLTKTEQLDHQCRELLTKYTWVNTHGQRILCWDFGRFMNHNCEANSYGLGNCQFEIAIRHIAAGEELTSDYATINLEEPLVCQCGSSRCRGIITLEHLEDIAPNCDALIRSAFTRIHEVQQPLWHWIES
ncbi:MAG: SET domain-containing protein-lysine N-methyltransferase [Nitrospirae bacterium]|nr:SET domain-containing protein-lysine N-methyltransferase [Nitrospirota bacterium]MDA1304704.1 SET domain-containing protein-lysine N-methyltransferase [Nitrospirota bacterium]